MATTPNQRQDGGVKKSKCLLCSDRGFMQSKHPAATNVACPRCHRATPKRAESTMRVEQILDELLASEGTGDH